MSSFFIYDRNNHSIEVIDLVMESSEKRKALGGTKTDNSLGEEMTNSGVFNEFKLSSWIFWIMTHSIVFPFAIALGFGTAHFLEFTKNIFQEIVASGFMYIAGGAIFGGMIGLVQWLFLRKKTTLTTSRWFHYSTLGICAGEVLGVALLLLLHYDRNFEIDNGSYGWLVWTAIYSVGGLIAGYLQSSCLKKITPFYRFWILGSLISWGLCTFIWTGMITFFDFGLLAVVFGGLTLGLLSAIFLSQILKKSCVESNVVGEKD